MDVNAFAYEMMTTIGLLQDPENDDYPNYGTIFRSNSEARQLLAYFLEGPYDTAWDAENGRANNYDRATDYIQLLQEWCDANKEQWDQRS
jgi:hypothetical protein